MSKRIIILIVSAVCILFAVLLHLNRQQYSDLITIEATFMQYACGDANDDMKVSRVNLEAYKDLIGKDIDPHVFALRYELKDYFFEQNRDYKFRLTGYISKDALSGCDKTTPKFRVKKIEWIDGSNPKTNWDFY